MKKIFIIFMLSVLLTVIYSCVKDSNANDLSNADTTEIMKYIGELESRIDALEGQIADNGGSVVTNKPYGYVEKCQRLKEYTTFGNGYTTKTEFKYDDQGRLIIHSRYTDFVTNEIEDDKVLTEYVYSGNKRQEYLTDKNGNRKLSVITIYQE